MKVQVDSHMYYFEGATLESNGQNLLFRKVWEVGGHWYGMAKVFSRTPPLCIRA